MGEKPPSALPGNFLIFGSNPRQRRECKASIGRAPLKNSNVGSPAGNPGKAGVFDLLHHCLRFFCRLGSPANMSSFHFAKVCPVFGSGRGRKTETANCVDRPIGVFPVKEVGGVTAFLICHFDLRSSPRAEPTRSREASQWKSPHARLRRGSFFVLTICLAS